MYQPQAEHIAALKLETANVKALLVSVLPDSGTWIVNRPVYFGTQGRLDGKLIIGMSVLTDVELTKGPDGNTNGDKSFAAVTRITLVDPKNDRILNDIPASAAIPTNAVNGGLIYPLCNFIDPKRCYCTRTDIAGGKDKNPCYILFYYV